LAMVVTMIVVALLSKVSPFLAVPSMIVFESAAAALPVTLHVPSAGVVRRHPIGAFERRARPVSVLPSLGVSLRIPVAFDPFEFRARPRRDAVCARRWRLTDLDANGNLRVGSSRSQKHDGANG